MPKVEYVTEVDAQGRSVQVHNKNNIVGLCEVGPYMDRALAGSSPSLRDPQTHHTGSHAGDGLRGGRRADSMF